MTRPRYSIEIILYDDENKETPILKDETFYMEDGVLAASLFNMVEEALSNALQRFGTTTKVNLNE